jgi:uncharacterized RDD family membrane protein YckC
LNNRPSIQLSLPGADDGREAHDPATHPELFEGIIWRRSIAFLLDLLVVTCLFAVALLATCVIAIASLGLISIGALLAYPVLGVLYDTVCLGGSRSATPGMRAMGLTMLAWNGGKPDHWQSFLNSVLFWTMVPITSCLVLLFAFFDPRGRCLHDLLAGTLVLRVR